MWVLAGGAVSTPHWATNRQGEAGWLLRSDSDCHLLRRRSQQQAGDRVPAPAPRPARDSRCPQWLLWLRRWRQQPRTLRGPGEPVHMLLWRGGAQRQAEAVLFKGQLPGSSRESESSAPFTPPPALGADGVGWRHSGTSRHFPAIEYPGWAAGCGTQVAAHAACTRSVVFLRAPNSCPLCSVRERARARSWRLQRWGTGMVSAQLEAVESVGSRFMTWQGEMTAATPASLPCLLESPAPSSWPPLPRSSANFLRGLGDCT